MDAVDCSKCGDTMTVSKDGKNLECNNCGEVNSLEFVHIGRDGRTVHN